MTTKYQLIGVSEVFLIVKLASLFYNFVWCFCKETAGGGCPLLKISWSIFAMRNNYPLRRMFGFLHIMLAELR